MSTIANARKGHPSVWRVNDRLFMVESQSLTLVAYRVRLDATGNLTCMGNSEGGRCWPFYQHATCKHCDAVRGFLQREKNTRLRALLAERG